MGKRPPVICHPPPASACFCITSRPGAAASSSQATNHRLKQGNRPSRIWLRTSTSSKTNNSLDFDIRQLEAVENSGRRVLPRPSRCMAKADRGGEEGLRQMLAQIRRHRNQGCSFATMLCESGRLLGTQKRGPGPLGFSRLNGGLRERCWTEPSGAPRVRAVRLLAGSCGTFSLALGVRYRRARPLGWQEEDPRPSRRARSQPRREEGRAPNATERDRAARTTGAPSRKTAQAQTPKRAPRRRKALTGSHIQQQKGASSQTFPRRTLSSPSQSARGESIAEAEGAVGKNSSITPARTRS